MSGWWEPEQGWELRGLGWGAYGEGGGWVNIRGLVYCVNEVHLFPWKMAPGGPGAAEKARRGLLIPDFVTSSLSRFHVFERFIKTPKPSHGFHLVMPVLGRSSLFLRAAFKCFSFPGWEGGEEGGETLLRSWCC